MHFNWFTLDKLFAINSKEIVGKETMNVIEYFVEVGKGIWLITCWLLTKGVKSICKIQKTRISIHLLWPSFPSFSLFPDPIANNKTRKITRIILQILWSQAKYFFNKLLNKRDKKQQNVSHFTNFWCATLSI